MNILLWVLQILLAFYYAMGGMYQANTAKLPKAWLNIFPKPVAMTLGLLQILFAVGLVLPGAFGMLPILTPIAAVCLAAQTLLVAIRVTRFRGLLWVVVPGLLVLFVAYGR